jgi:hypothetical protein
MITTRCHSSLSVFTAFTPYGFLRFSAMSISAAAFLQLMAAAADTFSFLLHFRLFIFAAFFHFRYEIADTI